jgi:hypothetical protein
MIHLRGQQPSIEKLLLRSMGPAGPLVEATPALAELADPLPLAKGLEPSFEKRGLVEHRRAERRDELRDDEQHVLRKGWLGMRRMIISKRYTSEY